MKFMSPGLFALCQNQLILFCFHFDIPEAGQFIRPVGFGPNDACHGVIHAIGSLQSPVQVKKAAALGDTGEACFHRVVNGSPHVFIFAQRLRVQLRITAAQDEAVDPFR